MERGHSLTGVQRFFVVSNTNDNHAVDHRIAEALQAGGRTADLGPLTMMPDDTQAVVSYSDRWTWDFGDHLVFLKISVRDPRGAAAYGSVTFEASIPSRDAIPVIVGRLGGAAACGKQEKVGPRFGGTR